MGLQFIEGWEPYRLSGTITTANTQNWSNTAAGQAVFSTSTVRNGTRAVRLATTGIGTGLIRTVSAPASVLYVGFAFYDNGASNPKTTGSAFRSQGVRIGTVSDDFRFARTINPSEYAIWDGDGTGTANVATIQNVTEKTYHYVMIKYIQATGSVFCWLDRDLVADTGVTPGGAVDEFKLGDFQETTFFDDIFLWADPTSAEIVQLETDRDFRVAYSFPTSVKSNSGWSTSGGATTVSTISNVPVSATQFIVAPSVGNKIIFDFDDISSGVKTVYGVQSQVFGNKTDAGTGSFRTDIIVSNVSSEGDPILPAVSANYFARIIDPPGGGIWVNQPATVLSNFDGSLTRVSA